MILACWEDKCGLWQHGMAIAAALHAIRQLHSGPACSLGPIAAEKKRLGARSRRMRLQDQQLRFSIRR